MHDYTVIQISDQCLLSAQLCCQLLDIPMSLCCICADNILNVIRKNVIWFIPAWTLAL